MTQIWLVAERGAAVTAWDDAGRLADCPDMQGAAAVLDLGAPDVAPRAVPCAVVGEARGTGTEFRLPAFHQLQPPDLTMGEELPLAGVLVLEPDFDGVICIRRATRALWAHVSAGELVSFQSSISGQLRAALAPDLPLPLPGADFHAALAEVLSRPERLAARLASLTARRRQGAGDQVLADLLAGWLLGAELAAAKPWWLGQAVILVAEQEDGAAEALVAQGARPRRLSFDQVIPAALRRLLPPG